jgi:hypothetical protein
MRGFMSEELRYPFAVYRSVMAYLGAALAGLLFGAGDQFLGSPHAAWAANVSALSAPWLLLPFAVGVSQNMWRRAAVLGLVASLCAVFAYCAMILSPLEGGPLMPHAWATWAVARTQAHWFVAALLSGPLYGVLGQRWRVLRWWPSALAAAGAVCLEPFALALVGRLNGPPWLYAGEIALGVVLFALFVRALAARRRIDPAP